MRLSLALVILAVITYVSIAIGLDRSGHAVSSVDRPGLYDYAGRHSHPNYERELFAEITKAWIQKSEQWFIKDYIVETGRWNW